MTTAVPLFQQEKPDTCVLACLRMVLAAFGTEVRESQLQAQTDFAPGGVAIEELERLAQSFGLEASIQSATVEELRAYLHQGGQAIVYLNRAVFTARSLRLARRAVRRPMIHAVVPIRISQAIVTYQDPLPPATTRKSIARFSLAQQHLGSACVLCRMPAGRHIRRS